MEDKGKKNMVQKQTKKDPGKRHGHLCVGDMYSKQQFPSSIG